MPRFRKKPVVIEAIKWTGKNLLEVITFTDKKPELNKMVIQEGWERYEDLVNLDGLKIYTLEGVMNATIGDYIIRVVQVELYPCKPDIFMKTYEKV